MVKEMREVMAHLSYKEGQEFQTLQNTLSAFLPGEVATMHGRKELKLEMNSGVPSA